MLSDYIYYSVENRGLLAFGIAFILFFLIYTAFSRINKNKAVSIIVALCVSLMAGYSLYAGSFSGWEGTLTIVFYVLILMVLVLIFWKIGRYFKKAYIG